MIKKTLAILFLSLSLVACNLGNATGYVPTKAEIAEVQVHKDTRTTIEEKFGPPTVIGENQSTWYYVASYSEYPGILPTKEVTRRVLEIRFDKNDRVISIKEYSLKDGKQIALNNGVTPTEGRKLSLWDQLRGSIGNFSAEQFLPQN